MAPGPIERAISIPRATDAAVRLDQRIVDIEPAISISAWYLRGLFDPTREIIAKVKRGRVALEQALVN